MRITGGKDSGRLLKAPKGLDVRPTPDLVKQAIFNSLGARVAGSDVLELFAGTGALSLECLSRGARTVHCIEISPRHAQVLGQNSRQLGLARGQCEVRVQDVFVALGQMLSTARSFDLILADPPYGEKNVGQRSRSFAQRLLDDERVGRLLRPEGLFILGHTKRDTLAIPDAWQETKMLKHGDTVVRFFRKTTPPPMNSG